ncbi:MAG: DsbA family protein [Solirubrobacterales bacterium]
MAQTPLTSAPLPPIGPRDHVRGLGPEAIVYLDLACPHCAASWRDLLRLPLTVCARHFPVASKHARAPALHQAAEAAGMQEAHAFDAMWDSILDDQGHQDDPHLWERARTLGLDLERFDHDRRSVTVAERVTSDFRDGIRAGVASTPTAFAAGRMWTGEIAAALAPVAATD